LITISGLFALQKKEEWADLKNGWPDYIDELDTMFAGNAVTGASAFAPGANRQLNFISSDDDEQATDEFCTPRSQSTPQHSGFTPSSATPASSGSKRSADSTRSTAASPVKGGGLQVIGKKPKNVAVRNMNMGMMRWQDLYEQRTAKMVSIWGEKKELTQHQLNQQQEAKDKLSGELEAVVEAAKAIGVDKMEPELWRGVCNIANTYKDTKIFLISPPAQQLQMIKDFAVIPVLK
jgi:hypothetical protein